MVIFVEKAVRTKTPDLFEVPLSSSFRQPIKGSVVCSESCKSLLGQGYD